MTGDLETQKILHRFDGAEHWSALPAEAQVAIGTIALELAVAWKIRNRALLGDIGVSPIVLRAATAAGPALIMTLMPLVGAYLPSGAAEAPDGVTPRIPSFLGGVCRRCGCSQDDACAGGCCWVAEDLCSACAQPSESVAAN